MAHSFGHNQVRLDYRLNPGFGGAILPNLDPKIDLDSTQNLLIAGRRVDRSLFFEIGGSPTPGKEIDTSISRPLGNLSGFTTG